jgi:predicted CXXCH cytochrome family protein
LEVILKNNILYKIAGGLILLLLVAFPSRAIAQSGDDPPIPDNDCLSCHATPNMQTELPSGEILYLTIDSEKYFDSEHQNHGLQCVQCHDEISGFPHPENNAETQREFTLQMYTICSECHETMYNNTLDSTHQLALAGGNDNAAVCTDCHGSHYINSPAVPRSNIATMCQQCHSEIFNQYQDSVHGGALLQSGDPNVPTCTDCHGVHNVTGPSLDDEFHLFSPQLCAKCHADEELMTQYGISIHVFETYISDFHGTTVILFEETTPDQDTNKPVCVDCHGVHNMKKVDDPESKVIKENLLATCQRCHPDATTNFPSSWLNHYQPTADRYPLVYFVNLFYKILIPVTVGGMLIFVGSDIWKKIYTKLEKRDD